MNGEAPRFKNLGKPAVLVTSRSTFFRRSTKEAGFQTGLFLFLNGELALLPDEKFSYYLQ